MSAPDCVSREEFFAAIAAAKVRQDEDLERLGTYEEQFERAVAYSVRAALDGLVSR